MRSSILLLALLSAAWPYRPLRAQMDVVVETRTFHTADGAAQVEVNMAFLAGTTVAKANERGFLRSRVEVVTLIEQGGAIKAFGKTEVLGPERLDSLQLDLVHQEFFSLSPGAYDLTIEARDLNSGDTTVTRYSAPLAVGTLPTGVSISDLLFAERITPTKEGERGKYGYTVVPLLTDYLPKAIEKLSFYAEVYGTEAYFGADSAYLLDYTIESFEKKAVFGPYKRSVRAKGRPVEAVMAEFDIAQLPSGNYVLAVEARDRTGKLVARREQFFQRNNPVAYNYDLQAMDKLDLEGKFSGAFANADTLAEHIASLRPIADPLERKIIDDRYKDRDIDLMRRFFYSFWGNRSMEPEEAWTDYREQVVKVNQLFGCRVLKGYETDRGSVFLRYGAPNTMLDKFNEMDTYPYTIWHYYRAGKYTNKRFVFYLPDLVTNCFQLLHSEVPGEIKNNNWNQVLHSRNVPNNGVQNTPVNTMGGDRANEFFLNPR